MARHRVRLRNELGISNIMVGKRRGDVASVVERVTRTVQLLCVSAHAV